jgi:AcrR family transcriptional regulator
MTTEARSSRDRPMRADARRNYERLLAEAESAFAKQGTDTSLEDIARRAGVGIGTLYRHFPTRDALLEAVLHDRFESLTALARELPASLSPREALGGWLRQFATQATAYRGLPASVLATLHDESSRLYASCHAMRTAGMELLHSAQRAGEARFDADSADVFILACSLAWATEQRPEHTDRFLALLMDGLRPPTA